VQKQKGVRKNEAYNVISELQNNNYNKEKDQRIVKLDMSKAKSMQNCNCTQPAADVAYLTLSI